MLLPPLPGQSTSRRWLRRFGIGSFVAALGVVTTLFFLRPTTPSLAQAPSPAPYQQNSPHWPHINILDFGREVQWFPAGSTRDAAYEWYARHVDVMETISDRFYSQYGSTASAEVKLRNPTIHTFTYDLDLSMCLFMNCNPSGAANTAQTNLPEDQYLHFSQDTQIRYIGLDGVTVLGTETIPGCPSPQPLTAACRVKTFLWNGYRWIANLQNAAWRQWFADHLIDEMALNSNGQSNPVDAIFLDEHAPGFSLAFNIGSQTQILSGGGIREYNGAAPRNYVTSGYYNFDALDVAYNADVVTWLSYLETRLSAVGKKLRPNLAGHFIKPLGFNQALAAKGVVTEHLHAADQLIGATEYQLFLDQVGQLAAAGGTVDLTGTKCKQGPANYTAGNYASGFDRFRMWNLASYYLAKEPVGTPGTIYFHPNLCLDEQSATPLSFQDQWLAAYETNVGLPIEPTAVRQQGPTACAAEGYKVFSRQYENALVLVRPRGGANCTDYGDATAVTVPLSAPMVQLKPDGTISTNRTSVTLRNAEAVILFPAPDTTAPAAVFDLRAG